MTAAEGLLLLQLINMGIDTGFKVAMAYDKIKGMTPEEVDTACVEEEKRTEMLIEIARNI